MRSNLLKRYAPASTESENTSPSVTGIRKSTATEIARFDRRLPSGFVVRSRTVSDVSSQELGEVSDYKISGVNAVPPELIVTGTLGTAKPIVAKDGEEHNSAPSPVITTADGLMCLPRELRDDIYTHLMSDTPADIQTRHTSGNIFAPLKYLPVDALPSLA